MQPDETSALGVSLGWGVNASTTFGGTISLKFGRAKNVQKSVRFTTTNLNGVDEGDPFGVEQKKFCEIWSTTNKVISAHVDLP